MKTRRQLLQGLVAAGALGAGGLSGLIQQVLAAGVTPTAPGVYRLRGKVAINGVPAKEGMLVKPGDTVVTGPGSEAVYVIGQDAFMQGENSQVAFGSDLAKDFFRVVSGKILSVFGKGSKTLQTATATIGIRGTGCYIEAAVETVYFCLCYGVADVVSTRDPSIKETIETKHHDHPVYLNRDSSRPMMVNAPVVNHSDSELKLLENLCGRWPPFYVSGYSTY
jgi:hypothetical protein